MNNNIIKLSALITAHNEEKRLETCLEKLKFADEIVVLLDKCTDNSKIIAQRFTDRLIEGSWEIEGERRNIGIEYCRGQWILEIDADEHVSQDLGLEICCIIKKTSHSYHLIPIDNYIGDRLVRYGWGASFGAMAKAALFRSGAKHWGSERVHPKLIFNGTKGPTLTHTIKHYVDRNLSDTIHRFDSYTTAHAIDLRNSLNIGSYFHNVRRIFHRFIKCYVISQGWKEGGYGFLIALLASIYPFVSYLKARYEKE
ncbi:MAG: glycosyltransferase family 2 protein [Rhodospirillaceae bacterium]|nr:glycosyltransferase family 2 protein [Rhodospirillaceae bacterium]